MPLYFYPNLGIFLNTNIISNKKIKIIRFFFKSRRMIQNFYAYCGQTTAGQINFGHLICPGGGQQIFTHCFTIIPPLPVIFFI